MRQFSFWRPLKTVGIFCAINVFFRLTYAQCSAHSIFLFADLTNQTAAPGNRRVAQTADQQWRSEVKGTVQSPRTHSQLCDFSASSGEVPALTSRAPAAPWHPETCMKAPHLDQTRSFSLLLESGESQFLSIRISSAPTQFSSQFFYFCSRLGVQRLFENF